MSIETSHGDMRTDELMALLLSFFKLQCNALTTVRTISNRIWRAAATHPGGGTHMVFDLPDGHDSLTAHWTFDLQLRNFTGNGDVRKKISYTKCQVQLRALIVSSLLVPSPKLALS